jgi:hypothetical protein
MAVPLAAIQGGIGLLQAGAGLIGQRKARRAAEKSINDIEDYTESQYAKQGLAAAQEDVNVAMPGMSQAQEQLGLATSSALRSAQTRKGGLQSVGVLTEGARRSALDLGTKAAEFKLGARQRLQGQRQLMTQEREKAIESRREKASLKANMALERLAAKRAMVSQGLAAATSAVASAASSGGSGAEIGNSAQDRAANKAARQAARAARG